jgi:hypothetical protein
MPGEYYGEITDKVLELLKEFGPMTAREISVELGVHVNGVSMILTRCRKDNTKKRSKQPKKVYVHSWTRTVVVDRERVRDNLRMVFAFGSKPDVKKPPPQSNSVRCRKKRANALGRVNSIFSIGARDMNTLVDDAA